MADNERPRIYCEWLKGAHIADHDADRYAAKLSSTGYVVTLWGHQEAGDAWDWAMEYFCESCEACFVEWHIGAHHLIVRALREHGLLPAHWTRSIRSEAVLGFSLTHDCHEPSARMLSTGTLVSCGGDPLHPGHWALEYRCEVCAEVTHRWCADAFSAVRAALQEQGLTGAQG